MSNTAPDPFFTKLTEKLLEKKDLEERETFEAFIRLSQEGETLPPAVVSAFLTALRAKEESVREIVGAAKAALTVARPFPRVAGVLVDIVGTGGDGKQTCNVSTLAALTVAAAKVPVVKHGNRAVSSSCGSADLLEDLGLKLELSQDESAIQLKSHFFTFLFAPFYHSGFKKISEIRKSLGFRTTFNIIGPLVNPARPTIMLLGVFDPEWLEKIALALKVLGCGKAWVVHGGGGTDELDLAGENQVLELEHGKMKRMGITPEEAGLARAPLEAIAGGSRKENFDRAVSLLQGETGPLQDMVAFNAGVCFYLAGMTRIPEGVSLAKETLKKGDVWKLVEKLNAKHSG